MIRAIIFDADGVLIHREKYFSERLRDEYGVPLEKSLQFFNGEFVDCLLGKKDLQEVLPKYLKEWGWEKSLDELLEYWFAFEGELDRDLLTYIEKLKRNGIKIYIGTNNEIYRTNYIRDIMGLGIKVHGVYGSGHIGFMKPDSNFFRYILESEQLEKEKVLFWDDDGKNVDAAKKYGLHAELYTTFKDFEKKMKTYVQINS